MLKAGGRIEVVWERTFSSLVFENLLFVGYIFIAKTLSYILCPDDDRYIYVQSPLNTLMVLHKIWQVREASLKTGM